MASVSGVSNSYSSDSIYGNKNIITGLASGLDTESMIENSVSGYKTKISQLQQQQTKLEWQQDAYRSITDKLVSLSDKYTSYTSDTNLYSLNFFKQSNTTATGTNAGAISAIGSASSEVAINAVTQLATAAKYTASAEALGLSTALTGSNAVDLSSMTGDSSISVTVDGVTKTYKLSDMSLTSSSSTGNDLISALNIAVEHDFGTGKVTFAPGASGELKIDNVIGNSLVKVTSNLDGVGIGDGLSNYLDTSRSIGDLMDGVGWTSSSTDANGDPVYDKRSLTINGVEVGEFSYDTSLSDVLNAINRSDAGVTASFSPLTGQFSFTAKDTGASSKIEFGDDLAKALFGDTGDTGATGANYTTGTDAVLNVNINGTNMDLTRSSNEIDIDGMTVTLKNTFNVNAEIDGNAIADGAVKFETKPDTDAIVSGIKAFVNDYNAVVKEIYSAFSTQPLEKNSSTHTKYEPLTEDDKADLSDSAIEKYEEKAKTGILFNDSDLSNLYSRLTSMVSTALNSKEFKDLGIETTYDSTTKVTTLKINESKLTTAVENDPTKVASFFTRTSTDGTSTGLMDKMKATLDTYASTSIATPGILVKKAGTTASPTSLLSNTVQSQIDDVGDKISDWQTKMSSKIDYYTKQFTALETLINEMNSQSSALASFMGY